MNEYSKGTQIVAVIISEIIAYALVSSQVWWFIAELIPSLLILFILPAILIILPTLFVYIKYGCKLGYLLLCIPIIFLCALIYCPDGWYFFIYKGNWFLTPDAAENWEYGIYISIEFLIVQSIPVLIVKGAQTSSKPDSDEQNEQTDKNN